MLTNAKKEDRSCLLGRKKPNKWLSQNEIPIRRFTQVERVEGGKEGRRSECITMCEAHKSPPPLVRPRAQLIPRSRSVVQGALRNHQE